MIFELTTPTDLTANIQDEFMLFNTKEKTYLLRPAAPVFQNAEKLFDAAKLALTALDELIDTLQEDGRLKPTTEDYRTRDALYLAIEACK